MMSLLEEAQLEEIPNAYPPRPRQQLEQLSANLRRVARAADRRFDIVRDVLDEARDQFLLLRGRVDELERQATVMVTVVASVADLPANASPRQWFRVQTGTVAERAAVYVGNGPSLPLTKLTPSAL